MTPLIPALDLPDAAVPASLPASSALAPTLQYFWVPRATLVNVVGFGLGDDEWHPYVAGVQDLLGGEPVSTILHAYYERYQPQTLAEVFRIRAEVFGQGLSTVPAHPYLAARIFILRVRSRMWSRLGHVIGSPNQHFGPAYGTNPGMKKACAVLDSIESSGYRPFDHQEGALRGFFVSDGDRSRFVVTDGNHRLAALRLLGIDQVLVHLDRAMPAHVRRSDLPALARPRTAASLGEMEQVFDFLLGARGSETARLLGLVLDEEAQSETDR